MMVAITVACCWLGLITGALTLWNLVLFRPPEALSADGAPVAVSVILPARNEEATIGACLDSLLASQGVALEVIVVDDGSTDRTAALVAARAATDPRLLLMRAPPLPPGWAGKLHACAQGAAAARNPILMFIDVDVRMAPDGVARMANWLRRTGLALGSGFPREIAETLGERMLLPLIHTLLLGYLPLRLARRSDRPGYGAGCGQLFVADAALYRFAGGHGLVRASWHDGVALPRAFRRIGLRADICDATDIAACRMYQGFAETWRGLGKNAHEGLATPAGLPVWTAVLLGGQVMPYLLLALALGGRGDVWLPALTVGVLLLGRLIAGARFRQSVAGMLLQPVGFIVLLAIQWTAFIRHRRGRSLAWRGRHQIAS